MAQNGAAFVRGEPPPTVGCSDCFARFEDKVRRVVAAAARATTAERPVRTSYYLDASISTGANDSAVCVMKPSLSRFLPRQHSS
jgi:hypothetical protein